MAHFDISCMLLSDFDLEDEPRKKAFLAELQADIIEWYRYCRMNVVAVNNYYSEQKHRICQFSFSWNSHMFILDAMICNLQ